jgi:hypothetical protein
MKKQSVFSEARLWITIAMVLLYICLTDLYVDYVISRELDSVEQMILSFVFLVITFYTGKGVYLLWRKKSVKQSKKQTK